MCISEVQECFRVYEEKYVVQTLCDIYLWDIA